MKSLRKNQFAYLLIFRIPAASNRLLNNRCAIDNILFSIYSSFLNIKPTGEALEVKRIRQQKLAINTI